MEDINNEDNKRITETIHKKILQVEMFGKPIILVNIGVRGRI